MLVHTRVLLLLMMMMMMMMMMMNMPRPQVRVAAPVSHSSAELLPRKCDGGGAEALAGKLA